MARLQQTKDGRNYEPRHLSRTPQRATFAWLFQERQGDGVSLKIGRYFVKKGVADIQHPETLEPKSVIELNNAELDELIALIEQKIGPMQLGAKQYVEVTSSEVEVLERFAAARDGESPYETLRLFDQYGLLPEHLIGAAMHRDRVRAVQQFEAMLGEELPEREWQKWFEQNQWLLGSNHVAILDERTIDPEHETDYLILGDDQHLDVIEIKLPKHAFWASQLDHGNLVPHTQLTKALIQSANYLLQLERAMDSKQASKRFNDAPIVKPRATLIYGRSFGWQAEHFSAQRLLNGSLVAVQVLTYDQVLAKAKRVVSGQPNQ